MQRELGSKRKWLALVQMGSISLRLFRQRWKRKRKRKRNRTRAKGLVAVVSKSGQGRKGCRLGRLEYGGGSVPGGGVATYARMERAVDIVDDGG